MSIRSSRRNFLRGLSALSVTGIAGCAVLAPQQRLMITVFNNTKTRHILELTVVDGEETVVWQYLELPAGIPNHSPETETVVSLGRIGNRKRLNVHAVVDGYNAGSNDVPLILDCPSDTSGNAITVRVQGNDSPYWVSLSKDLDANHCFTETETVSKSSKWLKKDTEA